MRVGVLGGGLQGCCTGLALAERGLDVTLFDRNDHVLSRAAVANEGKLHLGYVYAGDPTFATAKTMMTGARSIGPVPRTPLEQTCMVVHGLASCRIRDSSGCSVLHPKGLELFARGQ